MFNTRNGYMNGDVKLSLGNRISIQDGIYNTVWMIAGFDMESNQTASDGTVYDNGYGICLIPATKVTDTTWNASNTVSGGYKSSTMHNTYLPGMVTNLQNMLGSHIVQRNVLLSSSVDGSKYSNAYTWTTAYATLMSVGQMTGTFAKNKNKYDDGEANYKLPLFNFMDYTMGSTFWTRGIWGTSGGYDSAWYINNSGIGYGIVNKSFGVRPLIYIR